MDYVFFFFPALLNSVIVSLPVSLTKRRHSSKTAQHSICRHDDFVDQGRGYKHKHLIYQTIWPSLCFWVVREIFRF